MQKIHTFLFLTIASATAASTCYNFISPKSTTPTFEKIALSIPPTPEKIALPIQPSPITRSYAIALASSIPSAPKAISVKLNSTTYKVKRGDSLSSIFSKLDLSKKDLHTLIHSNTLGKQFASINPGKNLVIDISAEGKLEQLTYKQNTIDTLRAIRNKDSFDIKMISKPIERRTFSTQASINSSLFLDGKEAGLSDKIIMQLAGIFAWDIDFALNLRKGDQFTVVYEKLFVDDNEFDSGNIISAEFVSQQHAYTAVRFEDNQGNTSYFTPEGKNLRKAFLRTPIEFARISSHFNLKRKHPVLNKIRAHKGVDYAARTGTPIKSTGDGKIVYRGRKGGYGRVVIVQHGQKYSSLYAHMSKYKARQKVGQFVKQGETIGYVGRSGLATGPHLHYEFRVDGVHKNPLTIKLANAEPIKESLLAEFKKQTEPLIVQLNKAKAKNQLALNL